MSETAALIKQQEDAKAFMARRDTALRLYDNPDFKKLILKEFCVEECARYVHTSADPALKPENRADALALAQAAGHLRRWLSVVVQMGNQAEGQLQSLDQAIEEARQEGGAE
jgi:hypothetical protein